MKKLLLFLALTYYVSGFAIYSNLFTYDKAKVEKAFLNVEVLDKVLEKTHATLDDIYKISPVTENLLNNSSEDINLFDKGPESLFGIPPFWWGFFLNWVGALLVYLLTEQNKEYTKEAIIGFLVSSVLYIGSYFCCWGYGWFVWW